MQNYLLGHFQLDKEYGKQKIYGIVVVLEDAVVSRKKVYEKAFELLGKELGVVSEEIKNFICSHIKVIPLRQIENMILQNTSLLPNLISQADKPECWYDYNYSEPTVENGLIPMYEEYTNDLKTRASAEI